jgi:hypothetical protein
MFRSCIIFFARIFILIFRLTLQNPGIASCVNGKVLTSIPDKE